MKGKSKTLGIKRRGTGTTQPRRGGEARAKKKERRSASPGLGRGRGRGGNESGRIPKGERIQGPRTEAKGEGRKKAEGEEELGASGQRSGCVGCRMSVRN